MEEHRGEGARDAAEAMIEGVRDADDLVPLPVSDTLSDKGGVVEEIVVREGGRLGEACGALKKKWILSETYTCELNVHGVVESDTLLDLVQVLQLARPTGVHELVVVPGATVIDCCVRAQ